MAWAADSANVAIARTIVPDAFRLALELVPDHPAATGKPGAVVLVTPNWNPGGVGGLYHDHPIGVYYYGNRWAIFNQDMAPMPPGASFNVWIAG